MKKQGNIYWIGILSLTALLLLAWSFRHPQRKKSVFNEIDEFIKVNRPSENVVLVTMGADAVTAFNTAKGIVVVDAGISNSLTAKYRNIIEKELGRNDFLYLINTHSHPDHIGGNQVFSDAIIVGHENCLSEISDQWKDPEKIKPRILKIVEEYDLELKNLVSGSADWDKAFCQKARYQYAYHDLMGNLIITPPGLTFYDSLNLSMGEMTFNLIYFGRAHSTSDILIHIPEAKILMSGDLFFPGGRPSIVGDVNIQDAQRWIKVLEWLSKRMDKIDIVIGGHGQIMSQKDLSSFMMLIKEESKKLITKNSS